MNNFLFCLRKRYKLITVPKSKWKNEEFFFFRIHENIKKNCLARSQKLPCVRKAYDTVPLARKYLWHCPFGMEIFVTLSLWHGNISDTVPLERKYSWHCPFRTEIFSKCSMQCFTLVTHTISFKFIRATKMLCSKSCFSFLVKCLSCFISSY